MKLHSIQRQKLAGLLVDLSKILFGSYILGPFLMAGSAVKMGLVGIGFLCFILTAGLGLYLAHPKGGV